MIQAQRGDAGSGRRLCLMVGGGGGAGSMAIQVAKKVCGLKVIATASRGGSARSATRWGRRRRSTTRGRWRTSYGHRL